MSANRLSAIVCIAVCLSIAIMKMLFPTVYDLIGSSCLVLVGMSLLAVCLIFCAIPYMQCCHSPSNKLEVVSTPVINKKFHSDDYLPTYEESELDFKSECHTSSIGKSSIIHGESVESPAQVKVSLPSISPVTIVALDIEWKEITEIVTETAETEMRSRPTTNSL
uniref:Uncharacterized protein n=1 Tax=Daphnia galeata TaxID=27404 RepID=A0A8J2RNK5_9CRUS|nr:unnamed protein product [Daphnia galeata]